MTETATIHLTKYQREVLAHLYVGRWEFLEKSPETGATKLHRTRYDKGRIRLIDASDLDNACKPVPHYKVEVSEAVERVAGERRTFRPVYLTCEGNLATCDRCKPLRTGEHDAKERLVLSYHRHHAYDMVFGVLRRDGSQPWRVFSTRRIIEEDERRSLPEGRKLKVMMISGNGTPTTDDHVVVRKLRDAPGLYGLYRVEDLSENPDHPEETMYDILAFDRAESSLVSVFGIRSLSWESVSGIPSDNLFATFNNSVSLPVARHSEAFAPGPSETLGCLLPFETTGEGLNFAIGDPDVGVWVAQGDPGDLS